MTKLILDRNPLTGETVYFGFDEHSDQIVITHEHDVQANLDWAHELSTQTQRDRDGMRKDFWHYAHVPNGVIMDMKIKHGVDFYDQRQAKRVFELLNGEYKRCKVTAKHHEVKHG